MKTINNELSPKLKPFNLLMGSPQLLVTTVRTISKLQLTLNAFMTSVHIR